MRLLLTAAVALLAAAGLAACGTPSHDLFVAQRNGSIEGAKLRIYLRDDGFVTCNGAKKQMPSKLLIEARVIARDLADPAKRGVSLRARGGSTLRYAFRVEDGVTRFADNSRGQPPVFYRAALLVRQIAQGPCELPR